MQENSIPNLIENVPCYNEEFGDLYYQQSIDKGYEGIIYRMQDCDYVDGKSHYILKRKKTLDSEFKCIGIKRGVGKYLKTLGALICLTPGGKTFTVSGMTDSLRHKFFNNPPLDKMITVRYDSLSDHGIPIRPRFITVRDYE